MAEDKTGIRELTWLIRLQQASLPLITGRVGFLSDAGHVFRRSGDYCPFECRFCAEQRILDDSAKQILPPEDW